MDRDGVHSTRSNLLWTGDGQPELRNPERVCRQRELYARHITALAGLSPDSGIGKEIAVAFSAIPREDFVGPPPWMIVLPEGHVVTRSEDPRDLYQDVLVPLRGGKGLNNGQPSLHAMCFGALAPHKGEHAIHVGAGTGYYTAMLAMLVGKTGRVDAYEIEPELTLQAKSNLAMLPQVLVHGVSGARGPLPECDVLYVSAAAAEPVAVWLDSLHPGGRLLFPLEPEGGAGQMLLITKAPDGTYPARFLCGVQFVPCIGAQDHDAISALEAAFHKGAWDEVRHLYRNNQPDETCWCAGHGWWLSTK